MGADPDHSLDIFKFGHQTRKYKIVSCDDGQQAPWNIRSSNVLFQLILRGVFESGEARGYHVFTEADSLVGLAAVDVTHTHVDFGRVPVSGSFAHVCWVFKHVQVSEHPNRKRNSNGGAADSSGRVYTFNNCESGAAAEVNQ